MSKSTKFVPCIFQIFDLQQVCQRHKVQFSQRGTSMANIEMYKSRPMYLTVSEILTFQMFDLQKVDQGHIVQFSQ